MKQLREFFSDNKGKLSSNRVMCMLTLLTGMYVCIFLREETVIGGSLILGALGGKTLQKFGEK